MVYDGTQRSDILTHTVVNGITKTKHYHFKVRAINAVGFSDFSVALTSFAAVVPSVPLEFKYLSSDSELVNLSWRPPMHDGGSILTGYYVYYKITGTPSWDKTDLIPPETFEYQLSGLVADN